MLFYNRVKVLFDTGASNSFIVLKFVQDLGLVPQTLEVALNVVSPLGTTVKLGIVCKVCAISLDDRNFYIDLIVLSIECIISIMVGILQHFQIKIICLEPFRIQNLESITLLFQKIKNNG